MKNIRSCAAALLAIALGPSIGCSSQYVQKKQEMQTHWDKSSAKAQIPVITGYLEQGRIEQAKETLRECLKADPESPQAHYLSGRVHVLEQHYDKARQAFDRSVQLDPQIAPAWHELGSLAVLSKDYGRALECCKKANELDPQNTDYLLSLANIYVETEQSDRAIELLTEGLIRQPRNLDWMLSLASLHDRLGASQQAAELYEQALLLHGNLPQILEPCGYLYLSLGRWSQAEEVFKRLVNQYPEGTDYHTMALRSLALSAFNGERFAQALQYYDRLSVVCRDDADIWLNMAQSALGAEDCKRAADCASKALRIRADWPDALVALASAQYLAAQYDRAIMSFSKVTEDEKFSVYAWFMVGRCYQKLGQTIQANAAFEKAERIDPSDRLVTTFLKRTMQPL
ncbi:MAG: tetratricopeptide repeat protein [Planctomycetaceae bacterium]|nr:tetratricopeptide repeat protein [Planctomycetaceae bacterium]